ncbi:TadA family conjugal transfer-associated ATPase [Salinifilum ghardaiensis]
MSPIPPTAAAGPTTGPIDEALLERVRNRIVDSGEEVTPDSVAEAVRAETRGLVADGDVLTALRRVHQEFLGAGALEPLLRDPAVTDVLVTAPDEVWVDRGHGLVRADVAFGDEESVRRLAQRLALASGRRLDDAQPWVDAWLPRGRADSPVRLHAVLPPVAAAGTCVSLRVLRAADHDLDALAAAGMFPPAITGVLRRIIAARLAFLVVGGTAAGKTTLLAAMLGEVPADERIVSVEEAAELHPRHPHVVRLLTRPANVEGVGGVHLHDLVRQALRMRPDRVVVGEVRGSEVCELLAALNTGHEGGAGTLHANSPAEVPARMEALAALGGLSREALHSQLGPAVHLVLHVRKGSAARPGRCLSEIGVVRRTGGQVQVQPAWRHDGGWQPGREHLVHLLGGERAAFTGATAEEAGW